MKRILQLSLVFVAGLLNPSAHALLFGDTELLLVFSKTGFNDVEFNLGSVSNYLNKANGSITTITNTGITNNWNFGLVRSNFTSLAGVRFALFAATENANTTSPRVWVTDADPNNTPLEITPSARNNIRSKINGVGTEARDATASPPGPSGTPQPGAYKVDPSFTSSYTVQTSVGGAPNPNLGGTTAFEVEGLLPNDPSQTTVRFFQIGGSTQIPKPPALQVGSFNLGTNGVLTFTAGTGAGGGTPRPTITRITRAANVNTVFFTTVNGSTYQLVSSNLLSGSVSNWAAIAGTVAGNGSVRSLQHTTTTNRIFYGIKVTTP